jgi:5-methylcytosine-specific restriction endonuclease McrA
MWSRMRRAEARDSVAAHRLAGQHGGLEAGLDLVLAQVAKRRGLVERSRQEPRPSKPEHIPAHVRREVWRRDGGRCQWRLASGEICGCTRHLQLDHVRPLALGGTSTVDNVRILCRSPEVSPRSRDKSRVRSIACDTRRPES